MSSNNGSGLGYRSNDGADLGRLGVLLIVCILAVAIWPLLAWVCLDFVGGIDLSFAQSVGIGLFAGVIAGTGAAN